MTQADLVRLLFAKGDEGFYWKGLDKVWAKRVDPISMPTKQPSSCKARKPDLALSIWSLENNNQLDKVDC